MANNPNNLSDFIDFVTGGGGQTTKHLAGKHDQDRHGERAGANATPEQLAARVRSAAGRAEDRAEAKKPAREGKWRQGSNYVAKKSGDVQATIYTRGGQESVIYIPKKGINVTFQGDNHFEDAKALADAALRGEYDHPLVSADFDGLVKNYGLKNSYGAMQRGEWERFKLGIATNRSQLSSRNRMDMDDRKSKGIGIGDIVMPKSGLFKGVPMRIKGFGGKGMRIDPFSGLPHGKVDYYSATLFGAEGKDRFSRTRWNGLDTGITVRIPVDDF